MASISKRGPHQYQATVRRKGFPTQTATFETKGKAEAWATDVEARMARNIFVCLNEAESTTLGEALTRYEREFTVNKKSPDREHCRIKQLRKHPLAKRSLASLRSIDFSTYKVERSEKVGPHTVRIELALLSHVFTVARKEWSIPIDNPISNVTKPKVPKGRDRRLRGDEEAILLAEAETAQTPFLKSCIQLAIETGMRAGEIVKLTWDRVNLDENIIELRDTKNGDSRYVPLTEKAAELLRSMPRDSEMARLTTFYDTAGLSNSFRYCRKRAGIDGLRFHDLRHEAASRFAPHMSAQTLAKVMGWRNIQMAMRYYNPTPKELVEAVRRVA
jgi:integrase